MYMLVLSFSILTKLNALQQATWCKCYIPCTIFSINKLWLLVLYILMLNMSFYVFTYCGIWWGSVLHVVPYAEIISWKSSLDSFSEIIQSCDFLPHAFGTFSKERKFVGNSMEVVLFPYSIGILFNMCCMLYTIIICNLANYQCVLRFILQYGFIALKKSGFPVY
jgi:hypothetical protein